MLGNLALLPLLPSPRADTGRTRRDSRPHALLALYGAILLPATRRFFDLSPLGPLEQAVIAGVVALCSLLLWYIRRRRLLLRFLGLWPRRRGALAG